MRTSNVDTFPATDSANSAAAEQVSDQAYAKYKLCGTAEEKLQLLNVMKMAIETYVNVHLTEGGDVATVPVGV